MQGVEFAPSHFRAREFQFYEIPFLQIQISPIQRTSHELPIVSFLRKNNYVVRPKDKPKVWHVVSIHRGGSGTLPGDAKLLIDQLNLHQGSGILWVNWSEKNPAKAAMLWPTIQKLAGRELYVLIPGLLQQALLADGTDSAFTARMDQWLSEELVSLIGDMRKAQRDELASALLDEALADFPNDPRLLKWKAESESTDKTDLSNDP